MNKSKLLTIGLLQALGIIAYTILISGLLQTLNNLSITPPGILGVALMLAILVFSAAVTSSLVFGYAAYLALNKKVKEALYILGYTLLSLLVIISILTAAILV